MKPQKGCDDRAHTRQSQCDMHPDDTPLESAEKLRDGLKLAISQVEENKRREVKRRRKSLFGRLFG